MDKLSEQGMLIQTQKTAGRDVVRLLLREERPRAQKFWRETVLLRDRDVSSNIQSTRTYHFVPPEPLS